MDYDDNDFQSQNFQLAGEDSNKFPSSLRIFGLPKYDLDENLQLHLRFDSLVDTESLIGIHSQGSDWINNFSAGSSAIEFSSGAADSCSIVRQKNVWSEATSSESVEMLLKSVGEDDTLDQKATMKEAKVIEGFNSVDSQRMSMPGDPLNAEASEIAAEDPILQPDRTLSTCTAVRVEEMEVQHQDTGQGSLLEHFRNNLGESFLPVKIDSDSVLVHCKTGDKSNSRTEKHGTNTEIQSHADKPLEGGFANCNLDNNENVNEGVAVEVHGFGSLHVEACSTDVSVNYNNIDGRKLSAEVLSKHLVEKQNASFGADAVLLAEEAKKQEARVKNDGANYQCYQDFDMDHDHQNKKASMELEVKVDLSAQGYQNSFPADNGGSAIESVHQHENCVDNFVGADELAKRIHAGHHSTATSNTGNEDAGKLSYLEEHLPNKDDSQRSESQLAQIIDMSDGCGREKEPETLAKEISETQGQLTDNAVACHSSMESSIEKSNLVDHDKFVFCQPTSQIPVSECSGRYTEDKVGEKSEPSTPDLPKDDSYLVSMFPPEDCDAGRGCVQSSSLEKTSIKTIDDTLCKGQTVKKTTEEGDRSSQNTSPAKAEQQDTGVASPVQGIVTSDGKQNIGEGMETPEISHIGSSESIMDAHYRHVSMTQSNSADKDGSSSVTLIHVVNQDTSTEGAFNDNSKAGRLHSDDAGVTDTVMEGEPPSTGKEKANDAVESYPVNIQQSCTHTESGTVLGHHGGDVDSNLGSSRIVCGVKTVKCSSKYSEDEVASKTEKGQLLETISNLNVDDKVDSVAHVSKHGASSQNGRNFIVPIDLPSNQSKKVTGDEKRPVLNIQPVDFSQHEKGKRRETTSKKKEEKSVPGSSTEKIKSSRRRSAKEPLVHKQTPERNGNLGGRSLLFPGPMDKDLQTGLLQIRHPYESSATASHSPAVQKSGLPDLNSSISASALMHQPFTDLQQLQLRAQIFVYGSLIQGTPPDEACMVSAFGGADDSRNIWDPLWRAAVERFQSQKSPLGGFHTPSLSRTGIRMVEQATGSGTVESKVLSPPISWSVSKVVSTVPLPSPLWSVSNRDGMQSNIPTGSQLDFAQAVSPVHSYQATQLKEHMGNKAARQSHMDSGAVLVPGQSSKVEAAAYHSKISIAEAGQPTPVRETSTLSTSSMQLQPTNKLFSASAPAAVVENKPASAGSTKNLPNTPKSRKKKKAVVAPEERKVLFLALSQPTAAPVSISGIIKPPPTGTSLPLAINPPGNPAATNTVSSSFQIISSVGVESRAVISNETCSSVEQAKLLAEDAAAHAASAVRHGQGIWSQLATQKNSGLVSEVEEKLASAAAAAAAAASVAKAAAAAAKVASDAALQAKMMADEALSSVRGGSASNNLDPSLIDVGKTITSLSPVSILQGKLKTSVSSMALSAAKEVARRRVEATSAAAKRAENLNAIVKAAELAAEAVAQAGTVVAMGDPLPVTLNDLLEVGPEGYWRASMATEHLSNRTNHSDMEMLGIDGQVHRDDSLKQSTDQRIEDESRVDDLPYQQFAGNEKANVSPSDITENIIQKGALVEVVSDEDGLRVVWFSARVLDVKDGKAYVCYDDLLRDEGSDQLKEWIQLEEEGDKPPRIRIAHPMTAAKSGATRKRRREALSHYKWAIGDHVDAFIRDGWWEGIITEKNKEDETKLIVHFPAGGDSATVRTWNLRPSLVWKDGQWREWTSPRENSFHEGDTPHEKRQRITRSVASVESEADVRRDGKQPKHGHTGSSLLPQESQPLPLSAKERIFSLGNNASLGNTSDSVKMKRTGLQKVGSRVVFGVPKPGKKRKFMAVSEHYVAEKTDKAGEGNDALKFAKYLMPQATRSWRTSLKADPRGRGAGDLRHRPPKPVKSQNIRNKNLSDASVEEVSQGPNSNAFSNDGNILPDKDLEAGSLNSNEAADNAVVDSSAPPVRSGPSSKKTYSSVGGEVRVKGKQSNVMGKSSKNEKTSDNFARSLPDSTEPRRSNRRIQPTSRLLEGIQSSMLISKVPTGSHDKGSKALHVGKSSRGKAHG